ncbi:YxeA family protein [Pediococcus acidilactici]|uniref:YxeA family protein n=1 Tax=Pediococcus acidilactici TaxID=1254 RepID=UPI000326F731|nr:YxeA family protein [Pediococcus acidilactici]EOA09365.1 hypothetical protein PAD3_0458 [Pediococcus acidilactici D3]MCF4061287.1 YxeA family protein [Pediococcus acidilactici]MCJ2191649.1 YxeA family protein [Pediococcus acidilactici]MCW8082411.1 YxeA family protein [Pediococcus acidilactici]MDB8856829.1 YxeA family protein [Pediococcus acidilactici]
MLICESRFIRLSYVVEHNGGAYFWYKSNYGTENYYTQITNQGTKIVEKDDSGSQVVDYMYHQPIYDQNGQKVMAKFRGGLGRPLKLHAYLKVGYNTKRHQVISWEKVAKKDVPKAALKQLHE